MFNWIRLLFNFLSSFKQGISVTIPVGSGYKNDDDEEEKEDTNKSADEPEEMVIPQEVKEKGWSKNINDCHQKIKDAFPLVEEAFKQSHPDCYLKVDYTYRSPEFQFELYKKGRELKDGQWVVVDKTKVVTQKDGKTLSHHNVYPSQAIDVYVVKNNKIIWSDSELYTELGNLWDKQGLVSGATWKFSWKDYSHTQVDYKII